MAAPYQATGFASRVQHLSPKETLAMSTNIATQFTNGKDERNHVAKWTVMVYFAADNDLEEKAIADLNEMKKVGSTDEVNIVAQLDSRGRGNTFRFRLR